MDSVTLAYSYSFGCSQGGSPVQQSTLFVLPVTAPRPRACECRLFHRIHFCLIDQTPLLSLLLHSCQMAIAIFLDRFCPSGLKDYGPATLRCDQILLSGNLVQLYRTDRGDDRHFRERAIPLVRLPYSPEMWKE